MWTGVTCSAESSRTEEVRAGAKVKNHQGKVSCDKLSWDTSSQETLGPLQNTLELRGPGAAQIPIKKLNLNWGDDTLHKSISCSYRGVSSVPSTHMEAPNHPRVTPVPWNQTLFPGISGSEGMEVGCTHPCRQNTHIQQITS